MPQNPSQPDGFGHLGDSLGDVVTLTNAHPHTQHSVQYTAGLSASAEPYGNHGFDAIHIQHDPRDKAPEHHGPQGLFPNQQNNDSHAQQVF